ncbi:hypothetical protein LC613_41825 [Nostoc sphaeroides CHAB 2801]|uniref:hypothetical protein n=1 Tax=Nostoc sphaeroides TaxID=446679 RepID=UPI001E2FB49A|nr:hypothetical protein [Nostoc sphaeroides]MCC5633951.1 hypothetical protein [Nostoc sphaeroides CHAB 2801]
MVFSEKSDSCPQSQRKDDGNSSTAILHTRINPTKCYHTLWNGTDGYGIFQLLILPQLIDAIAKGKRENRECVYQFVPVDDQRDSIFGQWLNQFAIRNSQFAIRNYVKVTGIYTPTQNALPVETGDLNPQSSLNRDEVFLSELVSVSNNISTTTPVTDTTSLSISHNSDFVSGSNNNIVLATPLSDTAPHTPENIAILGWKGLKLKLQQGLDSAGQFYQQLVSTIGEAVGVADGEPYWNGYLGQWQVWVNFAWGCTSVVCDWLEAV